MDQHHDELVPELLIDPYSYPRTYSGYFTILTFSRSDVRVSVPSQRVSIPSMRFPGLELVETRLIETCLDPYNQVLVYPVICSELWSFDTKHHRRYAGDDKSESVVLA